LIPTISDRFSSRPPTTAPSMLAPRAAAESAERNSEANNSPAKKTGMAKMMAAKEPARAAEPGMREVVSNWQPPLKARMWRRKEGTRGMCGKYIYMH